MKPNAQQPVPPMRFRFERLGPIREAELELGDLTIIAGRNNTGKTYVVYTIYGFLKCFQRIHWRQMSRESDYVEWINSLAGDTEFVETQTAGYQTSPGTLRKHRRELLSEYADVFSSSLLPDIFSSRKGDFDKASVSIKLSDLRPDIANSGHIQSDPKRESMFQYDGSVLRATPTLDFQVSYFFDQYRRFLVPELSARVSIISAERFGISLFYKELDFTKNQLVELLQKLRDENYSAEDILYLVADRASSRYALPIKDNIRFTREISQIKTKKGELQGDKLFERIERLMDASYSASDDEIRFKSKSTQDSDPRDLAFDIPLHRASSSARGLSDLYFFLKHQASHNQLLIIDEPESHLDTGNQVQLARILAHFVKAGVRVLITTHSDYLLKEINNLIMLSSEFPNKEKVRKSLGYSEDDFLSPSLIRAYIAEDGGLSPCEIDAFGIDLPSFDQVINSINRASNELSTRIEG